MITFFFFFFGSSLQVWLAFFVKLKPPLKISRSATALVYHFNIYQVIKLSTMWPVQCTLLSNELVTTGQSVAWLGHPVIRVLTWYGMTPSLSMHNINQRASEVCGEKFRDFFHNHLYTFMVFQLYKTATSVSMKASHSSREFSLKLSLAYSEMDESTLLTHVCADFMLSRMTMQSQEKSYSWSESEMKQIANR